MNIYVGNLPKELSEDELRTEFESFGEVSSVSIIKDRFSDVSRGFGFVEMPNNAEAEAAIGELNGKEFKGRTIKVNEAIGRKDKRQYSGGRGGFKGGRDRGGFGGNRRY